MKTILLSFVAATLLWACAGKTNTPAGPVVTYFGDSISWEAEAIDAQQLVAWLGEKDSAEVRVKGNIAEVCQAKGCWMDFDLGNGMLMTVRFKDYGFFMPKDAAGQTAVIEGLVKKEVEDVAWLQHKAQDAGKTPEEIAAITEPETSYTFMARGVALAERDTTTKP